MTGFSPFSLGQTRSPVRGSLEDSLALPALTFDQYLGRLGQLTRHHLPLGLGEDGAPVLFNLADPRGGPLLVVSDTPMANTRFLQALLLAGQQRSSTPLHFGLAATRLSDWTSLLDGLPESDACLARLSGSDPDVANWLIRMAERAEQRYNGRAQNGPILILLDDLTLLPRLQPDARLNFEWLCNHGPRVQIWPVVSLTTEMALEMGRWVRFFRTRVLGRMPDSSAAHLGLLGGLSAEKLQNRQFAMFSAGRWNRFWVPALLSRQSSAQEV